MSKAKYIQKGDNISYKNNTDKDIQYNDVVIVGDIIGVAVNDIKAGQVGSVSLSGAYEFSAEANLEIEVGKQVYYDLKNNVVTTTSTDNQKVGVAIYKKAASETTAVVRLG